MTISRDQQRRIDFTLHRIRRPKTVLCQWCRATIVVRRRGRLPEYCSESHRQLAYQRRKWTRPHAVASLALGADISKMRISQVVLAVLQQLEIITTPPPEPPRRPHLKLVKSVEE
jgi:hypothetical protein